LTVTHHLARAVGSTSSSTPAYVVEIRVGRHELVSDELPSEGGGDTGPTPFGLFISSLVACTATTLRMYAERKGWALEALEVDAKYDKSDDGSTKIERTITVPAELPSDQRERLAEIADRTPVTLAVRAGTPINTTIRSAG
jgi:putative redox protein